MATHLPQYFADVQEINLQVQEAGIIGLMDAYKQYKSPEATQEHDAVTNPVKDEALDADYEPDESERRIGPK